MDPDNGFEPSKSPAKAEKGIMHRQKRKRNSGLLAALRNLRGEGGLSVFYPLFPS
jgi:hypothetical protein